MGESMMIIREYASEMEAIVAQNVLEANNIPCVVMRDNAGGMLPVLHMLYPVRLAVRPGDVDLAKQLLDSDVDQDVADSDRDSDSPE